MTWHETTLCKRKLEQMEMIDREKKVMLKPKTSTNSIKANVEGGHEWVAKVTPIENKYWIPIKLER